MSNSKQKNALNRIIVRSRLKTLLRIGGMILTLFGVMFLPACPYEPTPKATIFNKMVQFGTLMDLGIISLGIGVLSLLASCLIPGDLEP